ncbi:hypothetical protein CAI21_12920 [Alkalilimnicola ehrlichii]|uniref:Abasic site processing protein n=1 Tax=Alkalilimnicola ehrlichii TaxID=351052 RepID=A0A3E0WS64_9GAMM|nr:SOS response-associated peptidase [Alkalilimnicola ehrlichii]RFA28225.1 hypothetical protein CAI21_12920 [Alkalilimnicola ehrlichii]RFA34825.1 hypothetical protein CAL65_14055 [Alkalilimnicola ehrlichii]
MCGRFALYSSRGRVARLLGINHPVGDQIARYNVAPGTQISLALAPQTLSALQLGFSWWGFHPTWTEGRNAPRPINARAENVAKSRYFRHAFAHRRGLVPADGYYEWRQEDGHKQPYYIQSKNGEILMLAAIWEPTGHGTETSCAILTEPAFGPLLEVHSRMPVVLAQACWSDWLDPSLVDRKTVREAVKRVPPDSLEIYPVSTAVNRPSNNAPDLIAPASKQG